MELFTLAQVPMLSFSLGLKEPIRMSMSQTLAPHLPYLRRYARALTGSQSSGDAHVRAALTALLAGDQGLTEGVPPRVGLYHLFHAIWQSGGAHRKGN